MGWRVLLPPMQDHDQETEVVEEEIPATDEVVEEGGGARRFD